MQSTIREIGCRSILNRSRIPGIDYTVNPYVGCVHGCTYCYAQYMRFNQQIEQAWGSYCHVKINAASLFRKQILTAKPGLISFSTATDPYQTIEKKYCLTQQMLNSLLTLPFSISMLTKSDLVLRDVELLQKFPLERCEVGISLNTSDDRIGRLFEPGAPAPSRRIEVLKSLHNSGIRTWVFLAPVLPVLTIDSIESFCSSIQNSVHTLLVDRLNVKYGISGKMSSILKTHFPEHQEKWIEIYRDTKRRKDYYQQVFNQIDELGRSMGINVRFCS
ncbi:radical SAM protein [bacterium]